MNVDISQDKIEKIKECIKSNERYVNNEDLFDKFYDEVIKRGFIILKTLDMDSEATKIYLNKIVSSSIINVLDSENRLNVNNDEAEEDSEDFEYIEEGQELFVSNPSSSLFNFEYTPVTSSTKIKPNILQKFYDTVVILNSQNPDKEYLQIYNLRYIKKLPLEKVAANLNMPANVVSESLFTLMEEVRKNLE